MKATGIVRKLDKEGRFGIPKELCNKMSLSPRDPVEILVNDEMIILTKYQRNCSFCDSVIDLKYYNKKPICKDCLKNIKDL